MKSRYIHYQVVIIALLSIFSVSIYLITSQLVYRIGFPLDDACIHQTYARNMIYRGEWSFIPGIISAGSTAPLWSILISIGYLLNMGPFLWTFTLGWILLLTVALLGRKVVLSYNPNKANWSLAIAIGLIFEWHLVWSAVSGMETLLLAVMVMVVMLLIVTRSNKWTLMGALIGISVWVRPDGITLIIPAFIAIVLSDGPKSEKLLAFVKLNISFGLILVLYLFFNNTIGGEWLPNTFFAKQAEYAVEKNAPVLTRLLEQASVPVIGVGICLLPGFLIFSWNAIKTKAWINLVPVMWTIGLLSLYALRLPVTYQHGRYVIPMMPVFFLLGWLGLLQWISLSSPIFWRRVVSRTWVITTWGVLLVFYLLGARAYGTDVAIIESEMVDNARWIAEFTDEDSLIAAHDIGAIGFFSGRRIVDLAGLVSPDVIPIIRDEPQLAAYLNSQEVDYLVTFPGWYPVLTENLNPAYTSNAKFSPSQGGENMTIYFWNSLP